MLVMRMWSHREVCIAAEFLSDLFDYFLNNIHAFLLSSAGSSRAAQPFAITVTLQSVQRQSFSNKSIPRFSPVVTTANAATYTRFAGSKLSRNFG